MKQSISSTTKAGSNKAMGAARKKSVTGNADFQKGFKAGMKIKTADGRYKKTTDMVPSYLRSGIRAGSRVAQNSVKKSGPKSKRGN